MRGGKRLTPRFPVNSKQLTKERIMRTKKIPKSPRAPVPRKAGQVFRAKKGRGSYLRRLLRERLRREGE